MGKVPGIRAKKPKNPISKPLGRQEKTVFPMNQSPLATPTTTPSSLHEYDANDTTSWTTEWELENCNNDPMSLLDDLNNDPQTNSTCTTEDSSSATLVAVSSSEEGYELDPVATHLDDTLQLPWVTPLPIEQAPELQHSTHISNACMLTTLEMPSRREVDSQCCLECCQMIQDLENYIVAELKASKILLGIIRTALERLSVLITLQRHSKNQRCIMLFTTLMYQILELLEFCPSIVTVETNRQRTRSLAGGSFGIGFAGITVDAEEQSTLRLQTISKEVYQAREILSKLGALATDGPSSTSSLDSEQVGQRCNPYQDLDICFKDLASRLQDGKWGA